MEIFVRLLTGKVMQLNVNGADTIAAVKKMIKAKEGLDVEKQQLIYSGNTLEDTKTLSDYKIIQETTLFLIVKAESSVVPLPEDIQLTVESADKKVLIDLKLTDKVSKLREKIMDKLGAEMGQASILCGGKTLFDNNTLKDEKLVNGSVIKLIVTTSGGL